MARWFSWADLAMPIAPGVICLVSFLFTWHPLFILAGLAFLGIEGMLIAGRLGKI